MLAGEVRLADVAFWHTVVREQDAVVVLVVRGQLGRFRQGMDVLVGAVEGGKNSVFMPGWEACTTSFTFSDDGLRGGHGELRVQGNDQGVLHAVFLQLCEALFDAHGTVAHAQHHGDVDPGLQQVAHLLRVYDERRALVRPNLRVRLRRLLGRVFKMMPRTNSVRNTLGKSTTRGSMRNSSKYVRTSSLVGLSGEPRLMRNIPCFMCFS